MDNQAIEITLTIPISLYQELAIEAEKNHTRVSAEILSRLEKTFRLDTLQQELHNDIHLLKEEVKEDKKNGNGTTHELAIQNEELRIMMAKMERLQRDMQDVKNIVKNKIR